MTDNKLLEKLAELEHKQWSHWTRHFIEFQNPSNLKYWEELAHLPYDKLTETQKESDREWARKVLAILKELNIETIENLLSWVQRTTVDIQKQWGFWTVKEQINEVFTEVGELNQALRHNESQDRIIEEIWDVIISAITMAHTMQISPTELMQGLREVQTKILRRIKGEYYKRSPQR